MAAQLDWPALHGTPVILRRISIAWPPAAPSEDSEVIVLNSRSTFPDVTILGAEVLFLDLRLSLPDTNPGGVDINRTFAGLRETIALEREEKNAVRYHWKHAIDSHSNQPPNKGTVVKRRGDSGENIMIETGVGVDPNSGKMGPYEEVWISECIPSRTPFAFVVSDAGPARSTRFMAVLGSHAIGLCQSSADDHEGSQPIHAVRLRNDDQGGKGTHPTFCREFSTGHQTLEDQLDKFVEELLARGMEEERPWRRGERLILGDNQKEDQTPWTWVVWDAGHIQE